MRGEGYLRRRLIRDLRRGTRVKQRWNRRAWRESRGKGEARLARILLIGADAVAIAFLAVTYLIVAGFILLCMALVAWVTVAVAFGI